MKIAKLPVLALLSLFILPAVSGCARVEKFQAIEGDKEIPYESLGTLEVNTKATRLNKRSFFWTSTEVMTLGFADTPGRGDHYKQILKKKLIEKAKERYGADAVIKVQYWPDPDSDSFAHGLIYARGEMVKYTRFPETPAVSSTASNPV